MRLLSLFLLLQGQVPELLLEPGYAVVSDGDLWAVRKPAVRGHGPVTVTRLPSRTAAEAHARSLPRLRLARTIVRFNPADGSRRQIADWSAAQDALQAENDIRRFIGRAAPAAVTALFNSTPLYLARLYGASGHTAEDGNGFVMYLDPFRATGRLHAAATVVHELTHIERYRTRGFHVNRAAPVMAKEDFILLGLVDEFDACAAEAHLVRSVLSEEPPASREAIREPGLRWPSAVLELAGLNGAVDLSEARRQVALDLADIAARYWEAHHENKPDAILAERIRRWYAESREWQAIVLQRAGWNAAAR